MFYDYGALICTLSLIALTAGGFLLVFTKVHKEIRTGPCKFISYIVIILSIITVSFSGYDMLQTYTRRVIITSLPGFRLPPDIKQ